MKKILFSVLVFLSLVVWIKVQLEFKRKVFENTKPVKIAYCYGSRTNGFYRTHIHGFFNKEAAEVELYTKNLREDTFFKIPENCEAAEKLRKDSYFFGKVSGVEIVDEIINGQFEGGTIGGASFIYCLSRGAPIVAVAMLGLNREETTILAMVIKKGLEINSLQDFKNKILISRRGGPGGAVYLREFLENAGLAAEESIKIRNNIDEDEGLVLLAEKKIDGGLYHLKELIQVVKKDLGTIYQPMNWVNPQICHGLLVFRKDFLDKNKTTVQKIINAYVENISAEKENNLKLRTNGGNEEIKEKLKSYGIEKPEYDLVPLVRIDLLNELQDLLLKHGKINRKIDLTSFVDNGFVYSASEHISMNNKRLDLQ